MSKKDVFLRAAEFIDNGLTEASCDAIDHIAAGSPSFPSGSIQCPRDGASTPYADIFSPEPISYMWGDLWSDCRIERQQCRVLALLFAHWMRQTKDL